MATLGTDSVAAANKAKAYQENLRAKTTEVQHFRKVYNTVSEDVRSAQKVLQRLNQEGEALRQQLKSAEAAAQAANWYSPEQRWYMIQPVVSGLQEA